MAASPTEVRAPRQATGQDVVDAPAHLVAETVNDTLHTPPKASINDQTKGAQQRCRVVAGVQK